MKACVIGLFLILLGIGGIFLLGWNMIYLVGGVLAAVFVFAATICCISAVLFGAIILAAEINNH